MNAFLLFSLSLLGQATLEDGSLVFLENCNYFVERYTNTPFGHVAVAVNEEDGTYVYEAIPGKVRKVEWSAYVAELSRINTERAQKSREPLTAWVTSPHKELTPAQVGKLKDYLEGQLGRRYSVKGMVRGRTGDGIHCAEMACLAYNEIGLTDIQDSHKQSPLGLMQIVDDQSHDPFAAAIETPVPPESWCARSWRKCKHWVAMSLWCCGETRHWFE